MKQLKKSIAAAAVCVVFAIGGVQGQVDPINVVTSAVPFLRISPDSRAGGMGELSTATTPDVNAQFYNLAKYPFAKTKAAAGLTYTPWLKDLGLNDVFLATMAGYYQFGEENEQAVSASMRYFSLGNIQFTDNLGNDLNSFRPREFSFDLGYSRKLSEKMALGLGLRYIYSNLAGGAAVNGVSYQAGNAVAGDIGLYYQGINDEGNGWNFAAALTNLGSKIGYTDDPNQRDYIPANLALGAVYTKTFQEVHKVSFGIDINKLLVPTPPLAEDTAGWTKYREMGVVESWFSSFGDAPGGFSEELREFYFSLGAEYWYNEQFAFRTGYFYEDPTKGNRQYFTVGAGVKYNMFGLDFSYLIPTGNGVNRNPLSNTIRFGLTFDFGASGEGGAQ
ncbi:MAG TPA: type IX secretion system outer membrane channel protein PorV [Chitinophagaceae bacterium]|nr:type IX secretion system outer membrane channel protein PorV [Chitinophagaceae bacterium]